MNQKLLIHNSIHKKHFILWPRRKNNKEIGIFKVIYKGQEEVICKQDSKHIAGSSLLEVTITDQVISKSASWEKNKKQCITMKPKSESTNLSYRTFPYTVCDSSFWRHISSPSTHPLGRYLLHYPMTQHLRTIGCLHVWRCYSLECGEVVRAMEERLLLKASKRTIELMSLKHISIIYHCFQRLLRN